MAYLCDSCQYARLRDVGVPESRYCGRDGRSVKAESDAERCQSEHAYEAKSVEWKPATMYRHDDEIPEWRFD